MQSLPSDPTASGTGINPWWRYQEESLPGGGHVMVNVGTGNLVLQDDDMNVPHAGVALAFRRTYNSQSRHDVAGDDGWSPGLYGNGWTNTFDTHLTGSLASGLMSVYDIDGTRYDYTLSADHSTWLPPPGQYAALVWDGIGGMTWTKKSGTIYYFTRPDLEGPAPSWLPSYPLYPTWAGYDGRLKFLIGRNRNAYLSLVYSWDNGYYGAGGKPSALTVQSESGMVATLAFGDVNGHRLLQQLTFPDGSTNVLYYYDAQGNLTSVMHPPNNSLGIWPTQSFGYQNVGSDSVMLYAASPRWNRACNTTGCGTDGGYPVFTYNGSSAATSTVNAIYHVGVMNPVVPDGTNSGGLQSGYPTTAFSYFTEYLATGVTTPTYRDTAGHAANWVVDGTGRPLQTQVCTAWPDQSRPCSAWLVSNEAWDANNNLVSEVDPRGNETDYAYDVDGNTVAVAAPPPTPGAFRPTSLYSYDQFDNVVAYCDPNATHTLQADWTTPPSPTVPGQGGLCPTQSTSAARFQWTTSWTDAKGELTTATSPGTPAAPSGYVRTYAYDPARQGGVDYGLPTSVSGDAVTQFDGTTNTESQTLWYDANGNMRCYNNGSGTWVMSYDGLGRMTSAADPDDSSANAGSLCGKTTGNAGWNTQTTYTYFPGGAVASSQLPAQRAGGWSPTYSYDADGNMVSQTSDYGDTPGTTSYVFDGADRLIETQQPKAAGETSWLTRFVYDLGNGSPVNLSGVALSGYGNVISTQRYTSAGWMDLRMASYDALDRVTASYIFTPCPANGAAGLITCSQPPARTSYTYDTAPAQGLLASTSDPLNQIRSYGYDTLGNLTGVQYAGDNGATPAMTYAYDALSRLTRATSASLGSFSYAYDANGNLATRQEPDALGGALTTYTNYANGMVAGVSVASATLNQSNLFQYAYRADGLLSRQSVNYRGAPTLTKSYTNAGRLLQTSDVSASPSQVRQYDANGRLSQYTIPAGSYSGFTYDGEGEITGYQAYQGEQVAFTYNVRGELLGQTFSPNPATSSGETWPAFGVSSNLGTLVQDPTEAWDQRTGAVVAIGGSAYTYDAAGRLTASPQGQSYSYDAEGRVLTGNADLSYVSQNCGGTGDRTISSFGRYHSSLNRYVWGPEGHVSQAVVNDIGGSYTLMRHWDGDVPLYFDSSAVVNGVQVGTDAAVSGNSSDNTGLNVADRDPFGNLTSHHNATGYDAWTAPNPYHQACVAASSIAASSGYQAGVPLWASYLSPSVLDDGYNMMQSDSVIMPSTLAWAIPAGGDDPYVYDGNNPTSPDSARRSVSDYCGVDRKVVKSPDGPQNLIGCTKSKPYVPLPGFWLGGGVGDGGGGAGYGGGGGNGVNRKPRKPKPPARPSCTGSPQGFALPPNAPGIPAAFDAGSVYGGGIDAVRRNLGRGGTFDYQRYGLTGPNSGFNPAWVPASNFVVGVYMNGAGVSLVAMDAQGVAYAVSRKDRTPPNALKADVPLWNAGWDWAAANCR